MGIKDFRAKIETRETVRARPVEAASRSTTFIGEGCEMTGSLTFRDSVQIDGRIQGEVRGEKTVFVGYSGDVEAKIEADFVVIQGKVDGDVIARRKITLHKSARVSGEIRTGGIVVEEGACFTGKIVIGTHDEVAASEQKSVADKPRAAARPAAKQVAVPPPAPAG